LENNYGLEQRCPTFLSIGQILEAKSPSGQKVETKSLGGKFWSKIESYSSIKGAFSTKNYILKRSCGHSKKPWRAKICPRALGWAVLD
jgi:hypothetical protein